MAHVAPMQAHPRPPQARGTKLPAVLALLGVANTGGKIATLELTLQRATMPCEGKLCSRSSVTASTIERKPCLQLSMPRMQAQKQSCTVYHKYWRTFGVPVNCLRTNLTTHCRSQEVRAVRWCTVLLGGLPLPWTCEEASGKQLLSHRGMRMTCTIVPGGQHFLPVPSSTDVLAVVPALVADGPLRP